MIANFSASVVDIFDNVAELEIEESGERFTLSLFHLPNFKSIRLKDRVRFSILQIPKTLNEKQEDDCGGFIKNPTKRQFV